MAMETDGMCDPNCCSEQRPCVEEATGVREVRAHHDQGLKT